MLTIHRNNCLRARLRDYVPDMDRREIKYVQRKGQRNQTFGRMMSMLQASERMQREESDSESYCMSRKSVTGASDSEAA